MILPLLALIWATLVTGAAFYISLVEHPVRMTVDDGAMLARWQPSYKRALPLQAGLAIADGVGLMSWYQGGGWEWLAGSCALLANWSFTLIAILPTKPALWN